MEMRERVLARIDDEEVEVWNSVSVAKRHRVGPANSHETFRPSIKTEMGETPEYVTEQLAEYLWVELSINPEDHGIEVVDLDEVEVV